jgi:hypothetical protein
MMIWLWAGKGVVSVFGPAVLFWGLTWVFKMVGHDPRKDWWKEAFDPLGWLFGSMILTTECAFKAFRAEGVSSFWGWLSAVAGILALLFVSAAMVMRTIKPQNWKFPTQLLWIAGALSIGIIAFGFRLNDVLPMP